MAAMCVGGSTDSKSKLICSDQILHFKQNGIDTKIASCRRSSRQCLDNMSGIALIVIHMDNYMPARFHALADPTRLAVVQRLLNGPASVTELARPHKMALPPFMKHLAVLEKSGLISSLKVGRVRCCSINLQAMAELDHWFTDRRKYWEGRLSRLSTHLAETPKE